METTLEQIIGKKNDFKLCKQCERINWYENKICHCCNGKEFNDHGKKIIEYVEYDYKFYKKLGYDEEEIDKILVDI